MRTKLLLCASAFLACFTACSDKNLPSDTPEDNGTYLFNSDGKGYLKLAIDVPATGVVSRADNSTKVSDGEFNEYEVKNAWLLIFAGTDEANAKFSSAYEITRNFSDYKNQEISTTTEIIQEINGAGALADGSGNNLYAYVILNKSDIFKTFEGNKITLENMAKYDGGTTAPAAVTTLEGPTFSDFRQLLVTRQTDDSKFRSTNNGFFMSNSPVSTKNDANATDATAMTLVQIKPASIYASMKEAEMGKTFTDIYVERALAKVDLKDAVTYDGTADKLTLAGNEYTYEITGWALDNTAKQAFITRNIAGFDGNDGWRAYRSTREQDPDGVTVDANSRMIEKEVLKAQTDANDNRYRINFAIDPTFDVDKNDANAQDLFNVAATPSKLKLKTKAASTFDKPVYCFENTFAVDRMKENQTTRAIVEVVFKKNGTAADFYTRSDKANVIYASESDMITAMKQDIWNWDVVKNFIALYNIAQPEEETAPQPHTATDLVSIEPSYTNNMWTVQATLDKTANRWETGATENEGAKLNELQAEITRRLSSIQFNKYVGGKAYYPVLIRHFSDSETPWKATWATLNGGAYSLPAEALTSDPAKAKKDYLGRYGLVRNTWYTITVNSVKRLGYPGVPELPNKPSSGSKDDDEISRYLNVRINIVRWQKRSQNADL